MIAAGTYRSVLIKHDFVELISALADRSIQLVICDPPYNLRLAGSDIFGRYLDWDRGWLD